MIVLKQVPNIYTECLWVEFGKLFEYSINKSYAVIVALCVLQWGVRGVRGLGGEEGGGRNQEEYPRP